MEITRREFIKGAAGTAGAAGLLLLQPPARALARDEQTRAGLAMLVDVTKCVSCWWCYAACKEYNQLGETAPPDVNEPPPLSATVWTTLHPVKKAEGWVSRKQACNHCTQAACVEVCPTGALSYNSLGFVQYDPEKCTGCGYCAEFCPFGIPQLEEGTFGVAIMNKCTFCQDRVAQGLPTACSAACPTGAIQFGKRSDLITAAENRVEELKPTVPQASAYGINELNGLHVMYVLDDAPEVYGLPADPQVPDAVTVRDIFKWVGTGLAAAVVAGFGLNYLVSRIRMTRGEK
jgi:formate dehydrogenase iron-sulfur subunit